MHHEVLNNPQAIPLMLMALMKRLERIETRLEKKVAYLSVEEAVNAYRKHLREGISRRGRNYSHTSLQNFEWPLQKFEGHFEGKNVAEITTDECADFLGQYWGNLKSLKQRQIQLRVFFNFCIKFLKKKGSPVFHNPCELLDSLPSMIIRPDFIPVEIMRQFLSGAKREHHWLAFSILATSGLRINDLMNLRKCDIEEGRVLHLREHDFYRPKSGKTEEFAVIPGIVANRLIQYLNGKNDNEIFIPVSEIAISKAITTHGKQLGIDISPHSLRKWCATYWDRKGEEGMQNFILRHSAVKLQDRYIAPLTIEEVIEKQNIMEMDLWG